MQLMSPAQYDRHEAFQRTGLSKPDVRRVSGQARGQPALPADALVQSSSTTSCPSPSRPSSLRSSPPQARSSSARWSRRVSGASLICCPARLLLPLLNCLPQLVVWLRRRDTWAHCSPRIWQLPLRRTRSAWSAPAHRLRAPWPRAARRALASDDACSEAARTRHSRPMIPLLHRVIRRARRARLPAWLRRGGRMRWRRG